MLNITPIKTPHGYLKGRMAEYRVWVGMLHRCHNPDTAGYAHYGARGITVTPRWFEFAAFVKDMGRRPSAEHTLDRKNNDLGYFKNNCRWATPIEQKTNRRNTRYVEFMGERTTFVELAARFNFPYDVLRKRVLKSGMRVEDALAIPPQGPQEGRIKKLLPNLILP